MKQLIMQPLSFFKGRKLVIATMHKKERVISPLLEKYLGVEIVIPANFDSDKFGTFTREIKRSDNQLDTARSKACAAMSSERLDLAVSSEGSFGFHPSMPFVQSNLELILFIDKKNGLEIIGHHLTSKTNMAGRYVETIEEVLKFAHLIGFPNHGVILRKSENEDCEIYKNIQNKKDLVKTASQILARFLRVFIETDMRANMNLTRMKAIKNATLDLIGNIASFCPKCRMPGFVAIYFEKGLKCRLCGMSTDLPLNDVYRCKACNYEEKKFVNKYGKIADPQHCGYCNP